MKGDESATRGPSAANAKDPKRVRIHAVDAFVDVEVLAPFQEKMDALAREKPALVAHIANLSKGRG